jgi:hypothetical protein
VGRTIYLELVPGSRMASDLSAGGLMVQDKELGLHDTCTIVVFNDGGQLELPAKAVYCDGNGGVGLELLGFGPELRGKLEELLAAPPATPDANAPELPPDDLAVASELADAIEAAPDPTDGAGGDEPREDPPPPELEGGTEEEREEYKSLHVRLRGLNLAEQIKRARAGDATERMLLERMYGKNVWEPLLRNPRLTAPEVARIARMGALPRPLLEVIFSNSGWLQIPEVRRALLSNPRLGTDQILRVLRLMPKHELKLAAVQTAYPFAVRDAAKRMVKESAT